MKWERLTSPTFNLVFLQLIDLNLTQPDKGKTTTLLQQKLIQQDQDLDQSCDKDLDQDLDLNQGWTLDLDHGQVLVLDLDQGWDQELDLGQAYLLGLTEQL